jgi:GNAT superfamily N-acetyltransferase
VVRSFAPVARQHDPVGTLSDDPSDPRGEVAAGRTTRDDPGAADPELPGTPEGDGPQSADARRRPTRRPRRPRHAVPAAHRVPRRPPRRARRRPASRLHPPDGTLPRRATHGGHHPSWLAVDGPDAIGAVSLLVLRCRCAQGTRARTRYIINMYVHPDHRRRGHRASCCSVLRSAAGACGASCSTPPPDGRPLYTAFGFTPNEAWLEPVPDRERVTRVTGNERGERASFWATSAALLEGAHDVRLPAARRPGHRRHHRGGSSGARRAPLRARPAPRLRPAVETTDGPTPQLSAAPPPAEPGAGGPGPAGATFQPGPPLPRRACRSGRDPTRGPHHLRRAGPDADQWARWTVRPPRSSWRCRAPGRP